MKRCVTTTAAEIGRHVPSNITISNPRKRVRNGRIIMKFSVLQSRLTSMQRTSSSFLALCPCDRICTPRTIRTHGEYSHGILCRRFPGLAPLLHDSCAISASLSSIFHHPLRCQSPSFGWILFGTFTTSMPLFILASILDGTISSEIGNFR